MSHLAVLKVYYGAELMTTVARAIDLKLFFLRVVRIPVNLEMLVVLLAGTHFNQWQKEVLS